MTDEEHIEQNLTFEQEPEAPADFAKQFADIVGVNPQTGKPGLRYVWGMTHRTWFQGENLIHYIDPNGVYVGLPYFILEAWTSPEVYDREEWERGRWGMPTGIHKMSFCEQAPGPTGCPGHQLGFGLHEEWDMTVDALGPFPEQGVWDFLTVIRNEDMSYAGHDKILEKAREWKFNHTRPDAAKRAIADYREFQKQKEVRKRAGERLLLDRITEENQRVLSQHVPVADQGFSFSQDVESVGKRREAASTPKGN